MDYGTASMDPWSSKACCLPWIPSLPSDKVKTRVRGIVTIGSAGVGGIVGHPSIWTDVVCAVATSKDWAGADILPIFPMPVKSQAGTVGITPVRGDYSKKDADLSPLTVSRIVASGIRVRYIGDERDLGGIVVCITERAHLSLSAAPIALMWEYREIDDNVTTSKRLWKGCTYTPVWEEDYNFLAAQYSVDRPGYMAIFIYGKPGNQYEFDMVTLAEVVGPRAHTVSQSHVDMTGTSKVISGLTEMKPTIIEKIFNGIAPAMPIVSKLVSGALEGLTGVPMKAITSFASNFTDHLPGLEIEAESVDDRLLEDHKRTPEIRAKSSLVDRFVRDPKG